MKTARREMLKVKHIFVKCDSGPHADEEHWDSGAHADEENWDRAHADEEHWDRAYADEEHWDSPIHCGPSACGSDSVSWLLFAACIEHFEHSSRRGQLQRAL